MGHKIHPSGLRLGITQEHRSKWFANSKHIQFFSKKILKFVPSYKKNMEQQELAMF